MTPKEENRLTELRLVIEEENLRNRTKRAAAVAGADRQLGLLLPPEECDCPQCRLIDRETIRAVLIDWNARQVNQFHARKAKDKTGRSFEEVVTPGGTEGRHATQLSLFEIDQVIERRIALRSGLDVEIAVLSEVRRRAASRARETGLDPDEDVVIVGDYVSREEMADIRRELDPA